MWRAQDVKPLYQIIKEKKRNTCFCLLGKAVKVNLTI